MLPDWRALIIRMNLFPVVVKVRPAWRRTAYRLGRHPLPVPYLPAALCFPRLVAPESPARPLDILVSSNGHGGKPGPLAKIGGEEL
jgi:hypothetical protein